MLMRPTKLSSLIESGYSSQTTKSEIKRNAIDRIRANRPILDGLVGYESTVLPQLEHAILADHDIILLGERGQGKTKLIRSLVELLDEWVPFLVGSELNDDPSAPISASGRAIVERDGGESEVGYMHRAQRYSEKLATPDTSIADLVGEIDPIKVAEGRYLVDENVTPARVSCLTNSLNVARTAWDINLEIT